LDHLTVPVASTNGAVHDALFGDGDHAQALALLEEAQNLGTCAVAEVPLLEQTLDGLEQTVEMLADRGVIDISFYALASAPDNEPTQGGGALVPSAVIAAAALVEEMTHRMDVRYFWQPPVQREASLELAEQVRRGPRATGDVSMVVEPDGSVIPPRGSLRVAGNLLQDPWEQIWEHEAFRRYRERVEANTRCSQCPGLVICAADCPREPAGWSS
jgi:radical SAM protein with 4Fe4S-binding SPASM domain